MADYIILYYICIFKFALTNYVFACNVWFSDLRWSMKLRGVVLETKPLMDEMRQMKWMKLMKSMTDEDQRIQHWLTHPVSAPRLLQWMVIPCHCQSFFGFFIYPLPSGKLT